jgi:hypothetical protein
MAMPKKKIERSIGRGERLEIGGQLKTRRTRSAQGRTGSATVRGGEKQAKSDYTSENKKHKPCAGNLTEPINAGSSRKMDIVDLEESTRSWQKPRP